MAIRDIFWACPLCRAHGLRPDGRRETCRQCGASFSRGPGAAITARRGELYTTRSVADWLRELGEPQIPEPPPGGVVLGPERVIARVASDEVPVRFGGELLGWHEVYGPRTKGELVLTTDALRFRPNAGSAGFDWALAAITVVQPSSSALQIATGKTVASVRFPDSSLRLWSRALTTSMRRTFAARGCEIVEFQPMIRTRPTRLPDPSR